VPLTEVWQANNGLGVPYFYSTAGPNSKTVLVSASGGAFTWSLKGQNGGIIDYIYLGPYSSASVGANTLTITVDGYTVFSGNPGFLVCGYYQALTQYDSAYVGFKGSASAQTYIIKIPIPFNSSISITYANKTETPLSMFFDVKGRVDLGPLNFANSNHLHVVTGSWSSGASNQLFPCTTDPCKGSSLATLARTSDIGPGVIFGVCWTLDSYPGSASPATAPLEGMSKIYLDGATSPNITFTGNEEVFGGGGYFAELPNSASGSWYAGQYDNYRGLTCHSNVTWCPYRFFVDAPIRFSSGFKWTLDAGEPSNGKTCPGQACFGVTWTGYETLFTTVFYYTRK
jgi:Protein of unknown function (DUF2961)